MANVELEVLDYQQQIIAKAKSDKMALPILICKKKTLPRYCKKKCRKRIFEIG